MPYPDTGFQATTVRYTLQIGDLPGGNGAGAVITSNSFGSPEWESQIEVAVAAFRSALQQMGAQVTIYRALEGIREDVV